MAEQKKSSGIVTVRTKSVLILPPGPLGFSNLIKPDVYEGKEKFDLFAHYSDKAQARFVEIVQKEVVDGLWAEFLKAVDDKAPPKGGWTQPDVREWLDDHLKTPNERSKVQLPSVKFANEATYVKDGEVRRKTMKAYDIKNALLDLAKLKLGMGSLIQPMVLGGLWISPVQKQPQLSFKLQGVRVLQIVQYGAGGGGNLEEVSEEDLALLGDDFQASDLGAYAGGGNEAADKPPKAATSATDYEDDDDTLPF